MGETDKSNEETMRLPTKYARGWLIGGALLLYLLLLFLPLAINKWQGAFGLELKDFLTTWIALGGVVAVVFGIFQTQYRITQQQLKFDVQQKLQLKEQRDARFASGVELLGNPHESTRIGGAYNLYFLAREFPKEYLNPVCEILCAHLRSIAHKDKFKTDEQREQYPRNEVQTIIDLLFKERDGETIFKDVAEKNLSQTFLSNIAFLAEKLNDVSFQEAKLSDVGFFEAELSVISFLCAKLSGVSFLFAKLSEVGFWGAELDTVDFSAVQIEGFVNFGGTKLEDYSLEEIVKPGRSLELTSKEEEE